VCSRETDEREKKDDAISHFSAGEKKKKKTWWSINPRYQINGSRSFSLVTFIICAAQTSTRPQEGKGWRAWEILEYPERPPTCIRTNASTSSLKNNKTKQTNK
jgi:hypothetical protein